MDQNKAFALTQMLAEGRGLPAKPGEPTGLDHIASMRSRITSDFSPSKLGRWLGYVQGVLVAGGYATLDEVKGINASCADDAEPSEARDAPRPANDNWTWPDLRSANVCRQQEWTSGQDTDLVWRSNELAGEIAELSELLVIVETATVDHSEFLPSLTNEAADVAICIDLLGMALGQDPKMPKPPKVFYPSLFRVAADFGVAAGKLCNLVKKIQRERCGWPGSRASDVDLFFALHEVTSLLGHVVGRFRIDLAGAVRRKFNATSEKVGLKTRIAEAA